MDSAAVSSTLMIKGSIEGRVHVCRYRGSAVTLVMSKDVHVDGGKISRCLSIGGTSTCTYGCCCYWREAKYHWTMHPLDSSGVLVKGQYIVLVA